MNGVEGTDVMIANSLDGVNDPIVLRPIKFADT